MNQTTIEACARAAHEANRAYCIAIGDVSQHSWDGAPAWQRDSARQGVEHALNGLTPEQLHDKWCEKKLADGWMFGVEKDEAAKTHPCLVGYDSLPPAQRKKDEIFGAVVRTVAAALT